MSARIDRKSTRLNSSHVEISYAVFCLKKKKKQYTRPQNRIKTNKQNLSTPAHEYHYVSGLFFLFVFLINFIIFCFFFFFFFFFNDTATTEIYTLSLHDALPIFQTAVYLYTKGVHEHGF